ncbi:MAG: TetR/AcrR family transcriptional regulator [Solirubrobacteraceae bacterium]
MAAVDSRGLERPNKRVQQAAETRQRLIEAAARLFARTGYAASTVAAIGEEAGASRGLVNFHFQAKERLLHAVIEQLVAELEEQMFPAEPPQDPLAALGVLIDAHRRFLIEAPDRARLLFRLQAEALNPALGVEAFVLLHRRWIERTRPWWQEGIDTGRIDPSLQHGAVTTFIVGALRGIAMEWLLAPQDVEIDAAYTHLLRSVQVGLLPPAARHIG